MALKDLIRGRVTCVVDGETVEMDITGIVRNQNDEYDGNVTVKVTEIKPFLLEKENGHSWEPYFVKILLGNEVTCLVHRRKTDGEIEGDLYLL